MSALLEVLGRAHPMVLHAPIGFLLALAVLEFFGPRVDDPSARKSVGWLVLFSVLSTLAAVVTGLLHSRSPAFSGATWELHRNLGLALVPVVIAAWLAHRRWTRGSARAQAIYRCSLLCGIALLVPAGHFGAELTHGPGFVTEPWTREPALPPVPPPVPSTYASVIRPLLDARCGDCHGLSKQKAGLSLADEASIVAGGKHGAALDASAPAAGLLLARIVLDESHDKHMPPVDHDQFTPGELAALKGWILAGAPFEGVVPGLELVAASETVPGDVGDASGAPPLEPADPAALAALRTALVHVQPISQDSARLWIDFAAVARATDDAKVRELLEPVRAQLAELSLARTQITDATLTFLAGCENLRRLDLRATQVTDLGLAALASHAQLSELVLAQTALSDGSLQSLISMDALEGVHLWRSGMSAEAIARLLAARPTLNLDDGATPDSAALEAETAVVFTKGPATLEPAAPAEKPASLAAVNRLCPVSGAPVKAEFSIVHSGRVIGFCCTECPKAFWLDPAKYADRLN